MQKVRIMNGRHAGAVIEVCEPVPMVIQLPAILQDPLGAESPLPLRKDLRWDGCYEYRVVFFVDDVEQPKGEWRAFLA